MRWNQFHLIHLIRHQDEVEMVPPHTGYLVELIEIINKIITVAASWFFILLIYFLTSVGHKTACVMKAV